MGGIGKKRSKKRTHLKNDATASGQSIPKSMVIRTGASEVGKSLSYLTRDIRHMMEPHTAIRLKERRSNKLKDYITMAGPLGVTHLLVLSRTEKSPYLRFIRTPHGPTLHFRVVDYMLSKDLRRMQKNPKSPTTEYLTPPLLVMNHFNTKSSKEAPHEALMSTMFQNLFPPLSVQSANINSVRRVMLLNRREDGLIDVRHYIITMKPVGLSRPVKRLVKAQQNPGNMPDLHSVQDISDFVLKGEGASGMASDSEVDEDATVEVDRPALPSSLGDLGDIDALKPRQQAVKLVEVGPRMTLDLVKVTEGVSDGKVLYHKLVQKTEKESAELEKLHVERRALKEKRKREQAANVERKKASKKRKESDVHQDKPAEDFGSDAEAESDEPSGEDSA
ncbi:RNA-binding protein [Schizosaccharomyces japonicus yFS275]|uniref:RNA-binding protein n=1 Tax=Schizosaccharomyces japonicus (strain yFS275 / FY16936) TaxID=402676 RepID=B6K2F8_SCHJY|nr:RNA-binding protein [Schizosaccharomyces japonicus yFS275]EEB07339.1 RNA-binding protein [Schizosaccharomyces japonicus yFS275]